MCSRSLIFKFKNNLNNTLFIKYEQTNTASSTMSNIAGATKTAKLNNHQADANTYQRKRPIQNAKLPPSMSLNSIKSNQVESPAVHLNDSVANNQTSNKKHQNTYATQSSFQQANLSSLLSPTNINTNSITIHNNLNYNNDAEYSGKTFC